MDEEKVPQGDSQEKPRAKNEASPAQPEVSGPTKVAGWAGAPTSQVVRTVAAALLTTVVVLGALFLLWQVRTFVGWFVIALFLSAVLNPAVNWLQRRHRVIKRPLAIALTWKKRSYTWGPWEDIWSRGLTRGESGSEVRSWPRWPYHWPPSPPR